LGSRKLTFWIKPFIEKDLGGEIMPGFNRTGPQGYGPMSGRGLGPCGRGLRMGTSRGLGRGMGRYGYAPAYEPTNTVRITKEQEMADLKAEKELMQQELKSVEQRIKELEKE
jgi:hypothetical protein